MRFHFAIITLWLTPLMAWAQKYDLYRPPSVITQDRIESIRIVTQAEMELGDLPEHPKITWLGYSSIRLRNRRDPNAPYGPGIMQTENRISFIANAPGLIKFPPIPIVLENKEFFIRIGEARVERNPVPKDASGLEVFWNDQPEIPKQVHLGEAVEVIIAGYVGETEGGPINPYFSEPSSSILGSRWHQYQRTFGRKPMPSDYFFSYSPASYGLFRTRPDNYRSATRNVDGEIRQFRMYKTRIYFTRLGKASGHISMTMGISPYSQTHRTHVVPFEIEVVPLPPLPNDQAFDTGLIGDFEIESSYSPSQPAAERPFKIRLSIEGRGNPTLRNEFDFSSEGFPSSESELYPRVDSNYDFWEADFTQTLYPTGKVGTLPAITLASFDTVSDQWRYHKVSPDLTLPGFESLSAALAPKSSLGSAITRPVLLNLPVPTFVMFGVAPLLPFFFGLAKKKLDARDPEQAKRERTLKSLISDFQNGKGSPGDIDFKLLPILRHHLKLPDGATIREIAGALEKHPDLAEALETHAEASFSTTAKPVDLPALARSLAKLSLIFLFTLGSLRGATLEGANAAFDQANYRQAIEDYRALIEDDPNRPALHFNLAQAYFSANEPARAHASCHTALLLDPLDADARNLMAQIRERQGDSTVSRSRFLDLRPDQWIIVSSVVWLLSFLWLGVKRFRPLPVWPAVALVALALALLGMATWRQKSDYASDQYMVLADELPREPTAGTPNWNYPALRAGQIIRVSEINETHARVTSEDSAFWLPLRELQQVW